MATFIQRGLSLVLYGVLIVLALKWGTRSGGFFAAGGLIVMFAGNIVASMMAPQWGAWVTGVPNIVGLVFLLVAVIWNVMRHRNAEAGARA